MVQKDIHKLIEGYFDAALSAGEEDQLRQMLCLTSEDTVDIREAKATMGLFATNRKLTGTHLSGEKPKTVWGKMKYAAVLAIGFLLGALFDLDDSMDNDFNK